MRDVFGDIRSNDRFVMEIVEAPTHRYSTPSRRNPGGPCVRFMDFSKPGEKYWVRMPIPAGYKSLALAYGEESVIAIFSSEQTKVCVIKFQEAESSDSGPPGNNDATTNNNNNAHTNTNNHNNGASSAAAAASTGPSQNGAGLYQGSVMGNIGPNAQNAQNNNANTNNPAWPMGWTATGEEDDFGLAGFGYGNGGSSSPVEDLWGSPEPAFNPYEPVAETESREIDVGSLPESVGVNSSYLAVSSLTTAHVFSVSTGAKVNSFQILHRSPVVLWGDRLVTCLSATEHRSHAACVVNVVSGEVHQCFEGHKFKASDDSYITFTNRSTRTTNYVATRERFVRAPADMGYRDAVKFGLQLKYVSSVAVAADSDAAKDAPEMRQIQGPVRALRGIVGHYGFFLGRDYRHIGLFY